MSRRSDLEAALAKNEPAVRRLQAVKHRTIRQAEALVTDLTTQNKIYAELVTLPPDPVTSDVPPVVVPGDSASKSRAWNRLEATDNIAAVKGNRITWTPQEARTALGDGLFAQAIALGQFGSPYWGPGDADTALSPEVYAIGDLAGGFWGRRSGLDNKLTPGFYQRIYNASKLVAEVLTPSYMSAEDAHALALANGLNEEETGPA